MDKKEYNRQWMRNYRRSLKTAVLEAYGTTCVMCGFSDIRALQIDHIHGSGSVERRSLGGDKFSGWKFYKWLKEKGFPEGYQTLCANCNLIKHLGDDF